MKVTGNRLRGMVTKGPTIRKRFRAALGLAGITQGGWAIANGVTSGHVSQVLSGIRASAKLTNKIETFITQHLPLKKAS
jgi:hypothetical protein